MPLVRAVPFQVEPSNADELEVRDRTRGTARNVSGILRRGRAVASHREAKLSMPITCLSQEA